MIIFVMVGSLKRHHFSLGICFLISSHAAFFCFTSFRVFSTHCRMTAECRAPRALNHSFILSPEGDGSTKYSFLTEALASRSVIGAVKPGMDDAAAQISLVACSVLAVANKNASLGAASLHAFQASMNGADTASLHSSMCLSMGAWNGAWWPERPESQSIQRSARRKTSSVITCVNA